MRCLLQVFGANSVLLGKGFALSHPPTIMYTLNHVRLLLQVFGANSVLLGKGFALSHPPTHHAGVGGESTILLAVQRAIVPEGFCSM